MAITKVTDSVLYVGTDDKEIDLFEGQYIVPNGISYNSYIILDEKTALLDTVDARKGEEWLQNVESALGTRQLDYLIISHMEPDHAACIQTLCQKHPETKVVGSAKALAIYNQFFTMDISDRFTAVKEGDTLDLGGRALRFVMAPMVHWPEVMATYDSGDKLLFTADAFGKFGALDTDEDWACEARRYYINIVGKYGANVQTLLKKVSALDISAICPLHGPVLNENLGYYIDKYNIWSSYAPEDDGVLIAYASIYGNTKAAALKLAEILKRKGAAKVVVSDLARDDMAEIIEDAYRYSRLVTACPTYDGALFPCMEDFLYHLKNKSFQNRKVGIIENGSWAPMSGKLMRGYFEGMKNIRICENTVTVKSSLKDDKALEALADELLAD